MKPWPGVAARGQSWSRPPHFVIVLWAVRSQDYSLCLFVYHVSQKLCKKKSYREKVGIHSITDTAGHSLCRAVVQGPPSPQWGPEANGSTSQTGPIEGAGTSVLVGPESWEKPPLLQRAKPVRRSGCRHHGLCQGVWGLLTDRCMIDVARLGKINKQTNRPQNPNLVSGPWVTVKYRHATEEGESGC